MQAHQTCPSFRIVFDPSLPFFVDATFPMAGSLVAGSSFPVARYVLMIADPSMQSDSQISDLVSRQHSRRIVAPAMTESSHGGHKVLLSLQPPTAYNLY
jgi:hypothetical protein